MSITSNMSMYSLTLQPAGAITHAIVGNFVASRPKEQQVVLAQGERLSLLTIDKDTDQVRTILSHNAFGILRNLSSCRVPGTPRDLIIVSSDSGRVSLLQYDDEKNRFERVHLETFGKSGIRRTIPGQYLASDPRGRCCMFASVEKNKVVYILNRNAEQQVTISSPQEVNRPQTLTFDICAVDTNFQNPVFAALEVDYTDSDQDPTNESYDIREKLLVYYRVDLGLNHVVREWADAVDYSANKLFPVPGGADGPSGVVVCSQGKITYRHPMQEPHTLVIPRRKGGLENPDRERRIVAGVVHRFKAGFFHLLQTEDGDLFKLTMDLVEDDQGRKTGEVASIELRYFDTFPIASTMCILKSGYLFVAAENGDSHFYRFLNLGMNIDPLTDSTSEEISYFFPHDYDNVDQSATVGSMHPQRKTVVQDITGGDDWKIYTTAGTGTRSSFKTVSHGLSVSEQTRAELPDQPNNLWVVSDDRFSEADKYIVLGFRDATLFLEVGENTHEVSDHGLHKEVTTIHMGLMGDTGILQVWDRGFRFYTGPDSPQEDWKCPAHRTIIKATNNHQQLCLALSSGELLYFEVSQDGRRIQEYEQGSDVLTVSGVVQAMSMGDVPEGRVRAPFLVVGCDDSTIRVYSLDPGGEMLKSQSIQSLTSPPRSIEILPMEDSTGMTTFVHVGLFSGLYLRAVLDDITGELGDVRSRFLGAEEAKLYPVAINDSPAVLACGAKTFLSYPHPETKELLLTPLDYHSFNCASMLRSRVAGRKGQTSVRQSIVALRGAEIFVFSIGDTSNNILTKTIPLKHTPRDFCRHPDYRYFSVIQSDQNVLSKQAREALLADPTRSEEDKKQMGPSEQFGWPRGPGWASCIQVVDPTAEDEKDGVAYTIDLDSNEAALCCDMVPFENQDGETFLLVGTGKNIPSGAPTPSSPKSTGSVHVYRVLDPGNELELIHKTDFDKPIRALMPFQGRLALAVGNEVFLYDLGMKALLRKARCRVPGTQIIGMKTQGSRIVVGDVQESVCYVVYNHKDNKLTPFADDVIARWTTCFTMLDYDTVAGGDKFGNIWAVRCPKAASDEADEPGAASFLANEKAYLGGTPHRLALQFHNFVQDIPMSMQKTTLVPGGQEVIFWAGLQGTLGVFVPFVDREDVDFFGSLEQHLRTEDPPICGRDHLMYRSYYIPVKGCIDGDFCERYFLLSRDKKERIAGDLDRTVREVEKKIGEMRTRVAF
ncbi:putative splicing factor 3B subunit 3, partial [Aureobasidium melanogenum]|uniref:Putative splicing factor 3B subunit 3 n=1 Tax=Aureobasidium melanogenum (strain CBS 110374) TaxID=1043003 RepID=A0A074W351_AURM1